jgi:hypothetical protein
MVRLEAEVKQITHAIRMAAYNAETPLARALDGHYARAGDEAYAVIREALAISGDICPTPGELLISVSSSRLGSQMSCPGARIGHNPRRHVTSGEPLIGARRRGGSSGDCGLSLAANCGVH